MPAQARDNIHHACKCPWIAQPKSSFEDSAAAPMKATDMNSSGTPGQRCDIEMTASTEIIA